MSQISSTLRQLRLSGLLQSLEVRLQEAAAARLGHGEFLELILQDELNVRHQRLLARRTKAAEFRHLKTLEDFDWHFNPSIKRAQIFELAASALYERGQRRALHQSTHICWRSSCAATKTAPPS
jgi:DNA replication protein DnaC